MEDKNVYLPRCDVKPRSRFSLLPKERRAAVRALVEKGIGGLDEIIQNLGEDSVLKKRLEEYKETFIKEREERLKKLKERMRRELESLRKSREGIDYKIHIFEIPEEKIKEIGLEDEIIAALEGRYLYEGKKGLLFRLKLFLQKIVVIIKRALAWLKHILFGREGKRKEKEEVRISIKGLQGRFKQLKSVLGEKLMTDPLLQREVDKRMVQSWGEKGERIVKNKFSDEMEYQKAAEKLLKEILQQEERERERKIILRRKMEEKLQEEKKRIEAQEEVAKVRMRKEELNLKEAAEKWGKKKTKEELLKHLTRVGYLQRSEGGYEITESLVERFAELLYTEITTGAGGLRRLKRGGQAVNLGIYEMGRIRSALEEPHMELLTSLIRSKMNHPKYKGIYEEDMIVLREEEISLLHVVVLFDTSGSMDENQRLKTAKRAVLALYRAIKRENPNNIVDFVSFATDVKRVDLRGIISSVPHGFTNMEKALKTANEILNQMPAERNVIYVITDGLPEAYEENGKPVAGNLEEALRRSVEVARELSKIKEFNLNFFLLEPKNPTYVEAARRIASAAKGTLIITDPTKLERQVVERYYL